MGDESSERMVAMGCQEAVCRRLLEPGAVGDSSFDDVLDLVVLVASHVGVVLDPIKGTELAVRRSAQVSRKAAGFDVDATCVAPGDQLAKKLARDPIARQSRRRRPRRIVVSARTLVARLVGEEGALCSSSNGVFDGSRGAR